MVPEKLRNPTIGILVLLVVSLLAVAACTAYVEAGHGDRGPRPTREPGGTSTPTVTATPVPPTAAPTPQPTATPSPTAIAAPTATPQPTSQPSNERVTNGEFPSNISGWDNLSYGDGFARWTNGTAELGSGLAQYGQLEQWIPAVQGAEYCFSADVTGTLTYAYVVVSTGSNDTGRIFLINNMAEGTYQQCFTSPQDQVFILLGSGGHSWFADNVSLLGPAPATPPPSPTPLPTPTPAPTATPQPTPDPNAPGILDPVEGQTVFAQPGQQLSYTVQVQMPSGATRECFLDSYSGSNPAVPSGFAINISTCEMTWTPDSSNANTTYGGRLHVSFDLPNGSANHYVNFNVEVTDNPPPPPNCLVPNGAIEQKWNQLKQQGLDLGNPTVCERPAPNSPYGTTGMVADFEYQGAQIYWIQEWDIAYEAHGAIVSVYKSMGTSGSWLGFPMSDEYDDPNSVHRRSDFEKGWIAYDDMLGGYRAYKDTTGLTGDQLNIANTYNRIGGVLENQLQPFASTRGQLDKLVAVALGVWWVESVAEGPFAGPNGQPTIRVENHWLFNLWTESAYGGSPDNRTTLEQYFNDESHPSSQRFCYNPCADPATQGRPTNGTQAERYESLNRFIQISGDSDAGYGAISMGGPQVMGFNYGDLGYVNPTAMFNAFSANEFNHVKGFVDYMNNHYTSSCGAYQTPMPYAQNQDFSGLACAYNGTTDKASSYQSGYLYAKEVLNITN